MKIAVIILILILVAVATTAAFQMTQQADINYYQGHDRFMKGHYPEAIPFFIRAVSENPKHTAALTELAYSYLWSGKPQDAIGIFQKLLSFQPQSQSRAIKGALARLYSWNKEFGKSIQLYQEILDSNPEDVAGKRNLAEVYLWDRQYDKTIDILLLILEENPGDAKAKFLYAKALQFSGRTQEALRIYEQLSGKAAQGQTDIS